MKNLAMMLGCGLVAFAIGCGDGGGAAPSAPTPPAQTGPTDEYKKMMEKGSPVTPPAGDPAVPGDAAGEKKEGDAEKKEGDAEKKDAPAEDKKTEEKKEEGEKKE